ncbi:MAG: LptF/LptG family permease [Verrucomicrobiota bacterium]|nr:LptF/LptG family permease [Verrucomicrobiota bacterium]
MRLLDRYVLRAFLRAYMYCIAAFLAVWLVFDISDKISTFLDENVTLRAIVNYYLTQAPEIIVVLLPVALLLALIFCLSRMSRTNEIVSMLTAGISIPRLLVPLIAMGLLTTALSSALNYALAPHAEQARKSSFEEMRDETREGGAQGQIFRNRSANRTWFIQRFRPGQNDFTTVQVLQQDAHDNLVKNYMAASATYHPAERTWDLQGAKIVTYDIAGNILQEQYTPLLTLRDWDETPFRLASTTMRAEYMSLPELRDYLHFNSDFPSPLLAPFATHLQYRIALPWTCLIVVFIAAPLAIGFSRKGVLTSVAAAIGLVFSMNFLTHLFLALGEGDRVPAWAAAWTPNIIYAVIGLSLLYFRSTNREARELNPFARLATT